MSAEYLVSSLPPVPFDGPAPFPQAKFAEMCSEWLSARDARGVAALVSGAESSHPLVVRWRDLSVQMRNASAEERARASGADAGRWKRPASGCDIYRTSLVRAAFRENGPMARQDALDRAEWDAAGELVSPCDPLGPGAAFAYAVRLGVAERRSRTAATEGNAIFDRIAAAARTGAAGKE